MQLGTRWAFGAIPPSRLSPAMTIAIAAVEGDLEGVDTGRWSWTLTWLEGHPVAELDDGTVVRESHDGSVSTLREDADSEQV
jgi:hypothetical protein